MTTGGGPPVELNWRKLDEILTVLSHDLRSPLSAISVSIDVLADPALDRATRERYLAAMRRSVGRAETFLSDLLDASRIAAGKLELEPALVRVEPLLERAAREHESQAQETGTWIVVESNGAVQPVRADADRVLQALDKLITNAMRHARGSGEIRLRAEDRHAQNRDSVRLWVIDHGPGIPEPELGQIFDKCWRGLEVRRNGAGLGLTLAKGIAEAHGGSIRIESRPGDGARFCLELPAAACAPQ